MSKPVADPTSTVSVCVTPEEHVAIRDAAAAANVSVSAWGASRLGVALSTPQLRKMAYVAAAHLAASPLPRGARSGRVSVVMKAAEHDTIKAAADRAKITPHALCQAVLIDAAAREGRAMPAPVRREVEAVKAVTRSAGTVLVKMPADLAKVDPDTLSEMLAQLITATAARILDGKGRAIAEGVAKMAATFGKAPMVTVKVRVPELHVTGPAFVLGVPADAYATTLCVKAARVILAAAE